MLETGLIPYLFVDSNFYTAAIIIGMIGVAVAAYLLGSINSSIAVSKLLYRDDIRKFGSGNAGLTNMHRTFGLKAAGFTLLGDVSKTALSVFLALFLFGFQYELLLCVNPLAYIAGAFAVVGHVFPVYYGFKGGKGVLVTAVTALIVSPIIFAILLLVFIGIVALSKYISLGSVSVALLFPICLNAYSTVLLERPLQAFTALVSIFLAVFIVWLHRENLKRINDRTERKFSFRKKAAEAPRIEESEDDE